MAEWVTPKTDWAETDWFNAEDFNRIKNNLQYLRGLASSLYTPFEISDLGEDRTPVDYFYADEINTMEESLTEINTNTLARSFSEAREYLPNEPTMTYAELNRLESAILELQGALTNQFYGRRMLEFTLGFKGGDF